MLDRGEGQKPLFKKKKEEEKMDFFGRTCGFQVTLKFCHVEDSFAPNSIQWMYLNSPFLIAFDILILRANTEMPY